MSDIPEGATHTLDGFYFKIKGRVWFYYSSKPQRFNWRLSMLQNIYIENNATPIKQDKEMNIDWDSKEAEFKYCLVNSIGTQFFCRSKPQYVDGIWHSQHNLNNEDEHTLHARPKDKEMIYTKEMFNNSETPKVGMQIGVRFNKASKPNYGKLIALTNQYIILLEGEAQEQHYHRGTWIFVPVDTRTDTEKAVDDLADGISASYSDDQSFKGDAINMLNFIKAGKIHGVTFTGDK